MRDFFDLPPIQPEEASFPGATASKAVTELVYNGTTITTRDQMLSLTDMWKAAKARRGRGPSDWRELETTNALVGVVSLTTGKSCSDLFITRIGGRDRGTWAHWHIAMAYAQYLSPEFHMWCNEVVRAYMEGGVQEAAAFDPVADIQARLATIEKRLGEIIDHPGRVIGHATNLRRQLDEKLDIGFQETRDDIDKRALASYARDRRVIRTLDEVKDKVAPTIPNDMVTVGVVMERLRFVQDARISSAAKAVSSSMDTWYRQNGHIASLCAFSGGKSRRMFDGSKIDLWWDAVGRKKFGGLVEA